MGLLPAGRAKEDAFLTGLEPELMGDGLVWIIQFAGEIPQLRSGEVWVDPICVSGGGPTGFYATGDVVLPDGSLATRAPVTDPPTYRLPPLLPDAQRGWSRRLADQETPRPPRRLGRATPWARR